MDENTLDKLLARLREYLVMQATQPNGPSLDRALVVVADFSTCPVLGPVLEVKGELQIVLRSVPVAANEAAQQDLARHMADIRAACGAADSR